MTFPAEQRTADSFEENYFSRNNFRNISENGLPNIQAPKAGSVGIP